MIPAKDGPESWGYDLCWPKEGHDETWEQLGSWRRSNERKIIPVLTACVCVRTCVHNLVIYGRSQEEKVGIATSSTSRMASEAF